jgi:hypothetical protein
MDYSRLPRYPDTSPVRAPWWWRMPRPDQRDWLTTGLKALFVTGTLLGAFYLRSIVLTSPEKRESAINAANYDQIWIGMIALDVEKLFEGPGIPVAGPAWPIAEGERWVKWEDPTARERWIAVALRTPLGREGEPWRTIVIDKKKNGL